MAAAVDGLKPSGKSHNSERLMSALGSRPNNYPYGWRASRWPKRHCANSKRGYPRRSRLTLPHPYTSYWPPTM